MQAIQRFSNLSELIDNLELHDGMTVSFHHHLRNGDLVVNAVMLELQRRGIKDLCLYASSLFPCHEPLVALFKDGTITEVQTAYVSGPVARAISEGRLAKPARIITHGGRPRAIMSGEIQLDIAFVAAPAIDYSGAISGSEGPSACGSLGYAVADCLYANKVVAITDNLVEKVHNQDIGPGQVDYIVEMDKIGDSEGIVSGTTQVTRDPIGLKIARDTAELIAASGLLQDGFSFQTGAGGISLAVAAEVRQKMLSNKVKGAFGCGGITAFMVEMLEQGLFADLYDVQCFDRTAIRSCDTNGRHHKISADHYANPDNPEHVAAKLDCVVLGCSEIDLDFNVNVTTGSDGVILGGSGGHADTAAGAKLTIICSKLFNSRLSSVTEQVRTVTTPGHTVDALVTDYGIAVNPSRQDLIEKLRGQRQLKLYTIEEMLRLAQSITGKPKRRPKSETTVAYSIYRDGSVLDEIKKVDSF